MGKPEPTKTKNSEKNSEASDLQNGGKRLKRSAQKQSKEVKDNKKKVGQSLSCDSDGDIEVWQCKYCKDDFSDDDDKLLVCERCDERTCLPCTQGVTEEEYEVLARMGTQCHWYCRECDRAAMEAVKADNLIEQRIKAMNEQHESRFCNIERTVTDMQSRLTKMAEGQKTEKLKLSDIQRQLDEVKEKQKSKPLFSQVVQGGGESEVIEKAHVIQDSVKEVENRENRKNKLVWFGVPEKESDDPEMRKKTDLSFMTKLGEKVFKFENGVFKNAVRLGKKGGKDRPLLTVMDKSERVGEILRGARSIRNHDDYKSVCVKRDMTPLEREEQRRLVTARNQKREEAEKNQTGEWFIIRKGKVVNVTRRRVTEDGEEKGPD